MAEFNDSLVSQVTSRPVKATYILRFCVKTAPKSYSTRHSDSTDI